MAHWELRWAHESTTFITKHFGLLGSQKYLILSTFFSRLGNVQVLARGIIMGDRAMAYCSISDLSVISSQTKEPVSIGNSLVLAKIYCGFPGAFLGLIAALAIIHLVNPTTPPPPRS